MSFSTHWVQLVFQFNLKVFDGVEFRALSRTREFFQISLGKLFLWSSNFAELFAWAQFQYKGNPKTTSHKCILDQCVLISLWQQFEEGSHIAVMVM